MAKKLHHYIIPHENNNHRPHILRPRMLSSISVFVIIAKLFVTVAFLFAYNSPEAFAEISSRKIIELTNQSRVNVGAEPVTENALLTRAAYQKAEDMLDRDYFNHEDPDGNMPWYWLKDNGYIDALWKHSSSKLIEIIFHPGEESQIVTFSPDLVEKTKIIRRVATLPINNMLGIIHSRKLDSLLFN